MRFMILRKADEETEAAVMPRPSEQLVADMMRYNGELLNAGVMLAGAGLHPTSKGARVTFSGGKPTVIDGPFTEAKELVAGFTMFQVKSKEEAIEWVKRWPASDGDGEVEIEIRQVYEAEDFGEEFTPALRKQEERLRAQIDSKSKQS